jgi:hypothetical protein
MTPIMLIALVLQIVTIWLLRIRLGRQWLRRPVTLIVLTSSVYQGLSPVLLMLPFVRIWDSYRNGVGQNFVDSAMLIMSGGMLAFVISYLITRPELIDPISGTNENTSVLKSLSWKWLACACVPLAVLTYEGRGYNNATPSGSATSVGTDLASTFFIVLVVLTAFAFLLRYGVRWFIPVLIAQSILLAAAGERTPVIMDAITLILMLSYAGRRPSGRQLRVSSALTVVVVLALTSVRAEQGRSLYYQDSGLTARTLALGDGLTSLADTSATVSGSPGLVAQAAIRLDGVDFAGAILQSVSLGAPRLSAAYVPESLLIAVPSVAWSSKLAHGNGLNPTQLEIGNFGMQDINFLPTFSGLYVGFLSTPWLIVFLMCMCLLCGGGERLLFRHYTAVRLVLLAGAVIAALCYEKGLPGMMIAFRGALAIAICVKLIEAVRARNLRRSRRLPTGAIPPPPPPLNTDRYPGDGEAESTSCKSASTISLTISSNVLEGHQPSSRRSLPESPRCSGGSTGR